MGWTDNEVIETSQGVIPLSKTSPALSVTGTELRMVHLGNKSNQLYYIFYDGIRWVGDQPINVQKSKAPPALAGNHLAHLGNSSNNIYTSVCCWSNDEQIRFDQVSNDRLVLGPITSNRTPGLATMPNGDLAMAIKLGTKKNIFLIIFPIPFQGQGSAEPYSTSGSRTNRAPALAHHGGTLHIVHSGESSNNIWHAKRVSGNTWNTKQIEGQNSKSSPAIASFNGQLHMVHLGDSSNDIWHSIYIDELDMWTEDKIKRQKSKASPALAAFGDRLHMVHLGDSSNKIYHSSWRNP